MTMTTFISVAGDAVACGPQAAGLRTPIDTRPAPLNMPPPGRVYSDIRQKRDIQPLDILANGLKLYRYRYRWSPTEYVGVLAQEVAAIVPEAVSEDAAGFLCVDYR